MARERCLDGHSGRTVSQTKALSGLNARSRVSRSEVSAKFSGRRSLVQASPASKFTGGSASITFSYALRRCNASQRRQAPVRFHRYAPVPAGPRSIPMAGKKMARSLFKGAGRVRNGRVNSRQVLRRCLKRHAPYF